MYNIDVNGFFFILLFFVFSLFLGVWLLFAFNLKKRFAFIYMVLSAVGHFIGAIVNCFLSLHQASDSLVYFASATRFSSNSLVNTAFVMKLTYWLRLWVVGDSYLGVYAFFATVGFLGSVIYLVIFNELIDAEKIKGFNFSESKIKFYSFLIVCWPSALLWSSGLGKDALCHFFIALFFLSLIKIKDSIGYVMSFIISSLLAYLVRPYLFFIVFFAYLFWMLFFSKKQLSLIIKLVLFLLISLLFVALSDYLVHFGKFTGYDFTLISNKALQQQQELSVGSHIPLLATDSRSLMWFLPYTMFANAFMPLFFYIHNAQGIAASVENIVLLGLVFLFIKKWRYWWRLRSRSPIQSYMFCFFIVGISLLGLTNTNLGVAVRQKMMYMPVFLIIILITLSLKKSFGNGARRIE